MKQKGKAILLGQIGQRTILNRGGEYQPYVVALGYDPERGDWMSGDYFQTFQNACIFALAELGDQTEATVQMQRLAWNYQNANLADYLQQTNKNLERETAWDWAHDALDAMRKYDVSEEYAINATKERYM